jgi:hypothetical protein
MKRAICSIAGCVRVIAEDASKSDERMNFYLDVQLTDAVRLRIERCEAWCDLSKTQAIALGHSALNASGLSGELRVTDVALGMLGNYVVSVVGNEREGSSLVLIAEMVDSVTGSVQWRVAERHELQSMADAELRLMDAGDAPH